MYLDNEIRYVCKDIIEWREFLKGKRFLVKFFYFILLFFDFIYWRKVIIMINLKLLLVILI